MKKTAFILPVVISATILFMAVCFFLYIFRNNKHLTAYKLYLGGIILTFSSLFSVSCHPVIRTCYKPAPPQENSFNLTGAEFIKNVYIINNDSLYFDVYHNSPVNSFIYRIYLKDSIVQSDEFELNENMNQKFSIVLNEEITKQEYFVKIFENKNIEEPINSYVIKGE